MYLVSPKYVDKNTRINHCSKKKNYHSISLRRARNEIIKQNMDEKKRIRNLSTRMISGLKCVTKFKKQKDADSENC